MVAVGHRRRRRGDRARDIGLEQAKLVVRFGRGQLDQRKGPDELAREALSRDREVEDRPLGRGSVEGVSGDGHLAHRIAFHAGAGRGLAHGPDCRSGSGPPGRTYRRWKARRPKPMAE